MRKSKSSQNVVCSGAKYRNSYIVPGLGDFGDRFYTL